MRPCGGARGFVAGKVANSAAIGLHAHRKQRTALLSALSPK